MKAGARDDPKRIDQGSGFLSSMSKPDSIYHTGRWTRLRASVLRAAGYRCQYARRYGRNVPATTVHHIWPAEDYPEYQWARWNLIALSAEAHNAMHDRYSGKLSPIGEALRRRTIPPSSRP